MLPLLSLLVLAWYNWEVQDPRSTAMEAKSSLVQPECGMSSFTFQSTAALEDISGGGYTNKYAFPWIVRPRG